MSNAGLSTLSLAANTTITVDKGAQITLNSGGSFNARARRIENYGAITALGGSINLGIETNLTTNPVIVSGTNPNYIPLDERIYLANGSSLIARGERIDNSAASGFAQAMTTSGHTAGGSIQILDKTVTGQGVAIMPGALVDVSGGYQIDATGNVAGADAGNLALQGYSLIVKGDLKRAIACRQQRRYHQHARRQCQYCSFSPFLPDGFNADSPWPQTLVGQLILGASQLNSAGFTAVTLKSVNNVVTESGTKLVPVSNKAGHARPGECHGRYSGSEEPDPDGGIYGIRNLHSDTG